METDTPRCFYTRESLSATKARGWYNGGKHGREETGFSFSITAKVRGLQTSSKDGKNKAIETTAGRGEQGGWLKAVQAINSNSTCLPSNKFLNICHFPITLILNSASRQAKRSNSNLSAPLLTSRKDQDKLFIFLLFPFTFVIYIPIYLAERPPLLVNFWIITWGCRWNSNNRKENKNWNELGEEEFFNLKK